MTALEKLHQEAFDQGIDVINFHICKSKKAMCLLENGYKEIIIDKSSLESHVEELVLLAEELAHFETGSLYYVQSDFNTSTQRVNRQKSEAQARHHAVKKILPATKIKDCWDRGVMSLWEMSEELTFPVEYISKAIQTYRTKGSCPKNGKCVTKNRM